MKNCWLLLTLSFCGCTPMAAKYDAPVKYYGTTVSLDTQSVSSALDQKVDRLTPDAPTLLKKGTRVAFFPPDSCVNTTAAPHGATQEGFLAMQCGILMSNLETHVAKAGYEVVSWQALKPASGNTGGMGGRTIDRAKELGVKVLFEVDQLSRSTTEAKAKHV